MRPMLATPADPEIGLPGDGTAWAYEVKWDGMRVLADVHDARLRLWSRTGRDVTVAFPELSGLSDAHPDVLLDGEVIVLAGGRPSFAALGERMNVRDARRAEALALASPASLIAFDVLRLYGVEVIARPWQQRRESLERLAPSGTAWQISPAYDDRDLLLRATREQGLEGVVAKRRDSPYQPGVRSPDWVKMAHQHTQTCVIGGWRPESGTRERIGALLLGVWGDGGRLAFAGRVGSGITGAVEEELRRTLLPLRRAAAPFTGLVPREDAAGAVWVEPRLLIDVRHIGRTEGGRLRAPVFAGIRADLDLASARFS